jgi:uncharacterized membrane protein HdeD (DUF308 family)
MTVATQELEAFPWWLVLIQGIAVLILGVLLLISPGVTTLILIQVLGIYWLIDGIFSLVRIFLKNTEIHWGWLLARGILGILAGIIVMQNPLWSTVLIPATLVIILGIQGIIGGIIGLVQAFRGGGWGAGILGALGLIFGIILLFNPLMGALVLPWVAGIWGIIGGIAAIIIAFKIR